ncbi:MAG: hypothetical protein ACI9NN_000123, partial [Bacteroidia bacterium]
ARIYWGVETFWSFIENFRMLVMLFKDCLA